MEKFIFGILGGASLLMIGLDMLGDGLERAAGDSMRKILSMLTNNLFVGVLVGTLLTAVTQSSTAVTVLTVGFVNSGLMTLKQALGIIYGANIGTTMSGQILRLNITKYALPIIFVGVIFQSMAKSQKLKNLASAIIGFGLLFLGLSTLTSGSSYVSTNPALKEMLVRYTANPLWGVLIGLVVTAIIESSAAVTGLVIGLASSGLLDFSAATALILGSNVGTCVTSVIASLRSNRAAQRTALGHTIFNVIGVGTMLIIYNPMLTWMASTANNIIGQIANMNSIFNIGSTLIFIPFTDLFAKLLYKIIPDREQDAHRIVGPRYLDKNLLESPGLALQAMYRELVDCIDLAIGMYRKVYLSLINNDRKPLSEVLDDEVVLNELQDELTRYVVEFGQHEPTEDQVAHIPSILHIAGDAERIGDHAKEMVEHAEKKVDRKLVFSAIAQQELIAIIAKLDDLSLIARETLIDLAKPIPSTIRRTQTIQWEIVVLIQSSQQGHIERLEAGSCTVSAGILYMDILSHIERISEHLMNIVQRGPGDVLRYNALPNRTPASYHLDSI